MRTRPGRVPAAQLAQGDLLLSDPGTWQDVIVVDDQAFAAFTVEGRVRRIVPSAVGRVDVHTSACTWVGVAADEMVLIDRAPPAPTAEEWAAAAVDLIRVARRLQP